MKVDLVWVTPDAESIIAYIARVSNPENQSNPNYAKLIKYLIKNKHFSPFEMSHMCVRIETSRAIAAQILRHRSFSFQEYSQRYSEATEFEPIELRRQADKNRQSSTEVFDPEIWNNPHTQYHASDAITNALDNLKAIYDELIRAGVAKECARFILPLTTQTTLYMVGNCRSWMHYLALRNDQHAQKEHQLIAQEIEKIFALHYPCTYEALQLIKKEEEDKAYLYKLLMEGKITLP